MHTTTTIHATFPVNGSAGAGTAQGSASSAGREPPRLVLTVSEAAELLGISRAFAYELVARGELPSIHLGRRVVVPRVQLLDLIDGGPVAGPPAGNGSTASGSHRAG